MTSRTSVSASIAAQNTWTDPISLQKDESASVSISGSFSGTTVTLQRRMDGTNWRDVMTFTAAVEASVDADERQDVRLGVATGNYSAGPAVCRLGKG